MPYSALPEPMLVRSGRLPTRGEWAYEVKWDGFRAIALIGAGNLRASLHTCPRLRVAVRPPADPPPGQYAYVSTEI